MTAEQLKPGATFGREFRVERRIAAGGMGTVYECVQLSTGKRRALKVMHAQYEADDRARERFIQEARAGASIDSDHIVEMVAAGIDEESNTPWIAMELLNGQDLKSVLADRGYLSPPQVREVFRQLCHALAAAHRMGLVHRDLKPENIFLAIPRREGIEFTVKLLDFGIAKLVQEGATSASHTQAIGSPRWMSPEQAERGGKITPATDVWALGLIAFSLLTGKSYWKTANTASPSVMQQMCEVLMDPIEAPSVRALEYEHPKPLPEGFDGWFARCVVRDPFERFQDAQEALDAFQAIFRDATTPPERGATPAPVGRSEHADLKAGATTARQPSLAAPAARPIREVRLDAIIPRDETPGSLDASLPAGSLPSRRTADGARRNHPGLLVGATVLALGIVGVAAWATFRPSSSVPAPVAVVDAAPPSTAAVAAPVLETARADSAVAAEAADDGGGDMVFDPSETALAPPPTADPPAVPVVPAPVAAVAAPAARTAPARAAATTPAARPTANNDSVLPPSLANAVARLADAGAPRGATPQAAAPVPAAGGGGEGFYTRVMAMMRGRQADFLRCYEQGTQNQREVGGRLELQFTVTPSGRAENVRPRGLDAAPDVGTCVADIVRGMSFPPGDLGGNPLTHTMNFRREVAAPRPPPAEAPPAPPAPTPAPATE